jgi:hypothetical protein
MPGQDAGLRNHAWRSITKKAPRPQGQQRFPLEIKSRHAQFVVLADRSGPCRHPDPVRSLDQCRAVASNLAMVSLSLSFSSLSLASFDSSTLGLALSSAMRWSSSRCFCESCIRCAGIAIRSSIAFRDDAMSLPHCQRASTRERGWRSSNFSPVTALSRCRRRHSQFRMETNDIVHRQLLRAAAFCAYSRGVTTDV